MLQMDANLQTVFLSQFNFERFSADVYQAMAAALDTINLVGFAAYLRNRGEEERTHAQKFSDHLSDRNITPVFDALPAQELPTWTSAMDAGAACFKKAHAHEVLVTERIYALYELSEEIGDHQACEFLRWFITEQLEELKSLDEWLTRFDLARGDGAAILLLDKELQK